MSRQLSKKQVTGQNVTLAVLVLLFVTGFPRSAEAQKSRREIVQIDGKSIRALISPRSGLVHRLVNPRRADVRIGGRFEHLKEGDEFVVEQAGRSFLHRHPDLLRIPGQQLGEAQIMTNGQWWSITFQQEFHGIPVLGAQIGFSTDQEGRLIAFGVNAYPDIDFSVTPSINERGAIRIVRDANPTLDEEPVMDPRLWILPIGRVEGFEYRIVWRFVMQDPNVEVGQIAFTVDATTGQILRMSEAGRSFNELPRSDPPKMRSAGEMAKRGTETNVTGTITFDRYTERGDSVLNIPMPGAELRVDGGPAIFANGQGQYTFSSGQHTVRFVLATPYANAKSASSPVIDHTVNYPDDEMPGVENLYWSGFPSNEFPDGGTWTQANAVVLATEMHDYFRASPFTYTLWDEQMDILNAPGLNWKGRALVPAEEIQVGLHAAKSSDIVYHEYTHLVIYRLYGNRFIELDLDCEPITEACAMDEGFADYFAAAKKDNPLIGEHTPSTPRNLVNSFTMDDFDSLPGQHAKGQIIAGAVWDLKSSQGLYVNSGQPADFDEYIDHFAYRALWLSPHPTDFIAYALN